MNFLDLIILIFAALFFFKGWSQGLIVAAFKVLAYVLGILISMNFASFVSKQLFTESSSILSSFFPLISYAILFLLVVWLVHLLGKWLSKAFSISILGIANKMAGAVLYVLVYLFVASSFVWLIDKMNVLNPETKTASFSFYFLQPIAPFVFEKAGALLPIFKDAFEDLNVFFKSISTQMENSK